MEILQPPYSHPKEESLVGQRRFGAEIRRVEVVPIFSSSGTRLKIAPIVSLRGTREEYLREEKCFETIMGRVSQRSVDNAREEITLVDFDRGYYFRFLASDEKFLVALSTGIV